MNVHYRTFLIIADIPDITTSWLLHFLRAYRIQQFGRRRNLRPTVKVRTYLSQIWLWRLELWPICTVTKVSVWHFAFFAISLPMTIWQKRRPASAPKGSTLSTNTTVHLIWGGRLFLRFDSERNIDGARLARALIPSNFGAPLHYALIRWRFLSHVGIAPCILGIRNSDRVYP